MHRFKLPVKVGIIGFGFRGRSLFKAFQQMNDRVRVVAGADACRETLADFQKEAGGDVFLTDDYRELLKRPEVDAVTIATPDWRHEEQVVAAFRAGKHVFCEKPMAITVAGCDRMLRAWQKSGRGFMVGFNMRYINMFRSMREIVDSGVIGEIKAVWVRHFVGYGGDSYYHDWHATRKNTTGLLLQKTSHDFDLIHWITGQYTRRVAAFGGLDYFGGNHPDKLKCRLCKDKRTCAEYVESLKGSKVSPLCAFRKEINVEDNSVVMLELESGIKAMYAQCHFAPDGFRNYTFIGTEGRLENMDESSKIIVLTRDNVKKHKNYANRTYEVKMNWSPRDICEDFLAMILTGKEPVATPRAGRMSIAVGCAATESVRSGGKLVNVSPWLFK